MIRKFYLRKRIVRFLDGFLSPSMTDVVDARLDTLQLARREVALQPLDVEGVVVLQARLLFDDGKLLHLGPSEAKTLDAKMETQKMGERLTHF